jgi:hypothetical protein
VNAGPLGLNAGPLGLNAYDALDDAWIGGGQSTGSCFALVVATWPAYAPAPAPVRLVLVGDTVGEALMVIVGVGVALWVGVGGGEVDGAEAVGLGVALDEQLGNGAPAGLPMG